MPAKKSPAAKTTKTAPRSSSRSTRRTEKNGAPAGETLVTIDRRSKGRCSEKAEDQATETAAPAVALERRKKVQRRRQIDPTTCERDYSIEEVEFMNSMDEYKRTSGRMFPTCSEVLEVIRGLGYAKLSASERTLLGLDATPTVDEKLDSVEETLDSLMDETF